MADAPHRHVSRRRAVGESTAVVAGTAVNGLLAYAYIAIGTRSYGDAAMAPVAVLWTFWAISVALFMFPLQHWVIRQISIDGDTSGVAGTVPRIAVTVVTLAILGSAATLLWSERLFGDSDIRWPLLVGLITVGSGLSGLQRGILAGLGRYYATAANIAAENVLRVALGIVVAMTIEDVAWFAVVLAAGPLVAVFWPETFRLDLRSGERLPAFVFLGGLAGGILIAQVILNAAPVVLQAMGGVADEVTALFLALALFRAPYLLALGGATRLTAPLTHLMRSSPEGRIRRIATAVAATAIVGAGAAYAFGRTVGPPLIDLVFAPETTIGSRPIGAIAAACTLALGGLVLILMLTAAGRAGAVQGAMVVALLAAVVALTAWPGETLDVVVAAFVVSELVAVLALYALVASSSRDSSVAG